MRCLLIYDIAHDGARAKAAEVCLDYGLDRLQYSAFAGDLSKGQQEELLLKIRKKVGKKTANVQIIPICANDWAGRLSYVVEPQDAVDDEGEDAAAGGKRARRRSGAAKEAV